MKYKLSLFLILLLSTSLFFMSGVAFSDDDDDHDGEGGYMSRVFAGSNNAGVAPVKNPQYQEECGGCHFAYQPGLLPARSWKKMMSSLDNHFDESAEMTPEDVKTLTDYLVKNAADNSQYRRSRRIMNSLSSAATPLRISETPYFIRKHDELPRKIVEGNPKVGSYSNCAACHTRAESGSFSERQVKIPGYGRWDD